MANFLAKGSWMVCISLGRKEGKASAATTRWEEILALHLSGNDKAAEEPVDTEKNMLGGCSEEDGERCRILCYATVTHTVSDMQSLFLEWCKWCEYVLKGGGSCGVVIRVKCLRVGTLVRGSYFLLRYFSTFFQLNIKQQCCVNIDNYYYYCAVN